MPNYKRCSVVFNLDNPSHKELYEWCMSTSSNFSDFSRSVLFSYMQSMRKSTLTHLPLIVPKYGGMFEAEEGEIDVSGHISPSENVGGKISDADAMSGLL